MPEPRVTLSVEQYLAEVCSLVPPGPLGVETVALADAAGRVLADGIASRGPVPAFDNSAMDGYAVRRADLAEGTRLRVVADVPAGSDADPDLPPGAAIRIMTGAPLPSAADAVVPIEATDEGRPVVTINAVPAPGAHIRRAGEDRAAGDVVLGPGTRLGPAALTSVAGAGHGEIAVARRPRVAIAATGDELVAPGSDLRRGQIYESNSLYLAAAAARDGADARRAAAFPDDPDAFRAALAGLAADADLVVLTGGVSVGDYDVVRIVLAEGESAFRHVQMQPGKPQGWAVLAVGGRRVPVLCLPGNPLSTMVSYELFVRPALERMLALAPRPWGTAVAGEEWPSPRGRRQFIPVALRTGPDGRLLATPAHRRGSASHMVTGFAAADALADVPAETDRVEPGVILPVRSLA